MVNLEVVPQRGEVKLDLGCGSNPQPGHVGVDMRPLPGVEHVLDLRGRWPWADGSVDSVFCNHLVEHFTWPERVHFFNELHRVLRLGGKAEIRIPHWASARWYGDPTHQAPMSHFAFFYMSREWREKSDTDLGYTGYTCDFSAEIEVVPEVSGSVCGETFTVTPYRDLVAFLTKR